MTDYFCIFYKKSKIYKFMLLFKQSIKDISFKLIICSDFLEGRKLIPIINSHLTVNYWFCFINLHIKINISYRINNKVLRIIKLIILRIWFINQLTIDSCLNKIKNKIKYTFLCWLLSSTRFMISFLSFRCKRIEFLMMRSRKIHYFNFTCIKKANVFQSFQPSL